MDSKKLEARARKVEVVRYDLVIRQVTMKQAQKIVKYAKKRGIINNIEDITVGQIKEDP